MFVAEGAYDVITGRRQDAVDEAVKLIGRNVSGVQGDPANFDDLDRHLEIVRRGKGAIDVLCASTGGGSQGKLGAITEEQFDEGFDRSVRHSPTGLPFFLSTAGWASIPDR